MHTNLKTAILTSAVTVLSIVSGHAQEDNVGRAIDSAIFGPQSDLDYDGHGFVIFPAQWQIAGATTVLTGKLSHALNHRHDDQIYYRITLKQGAQPKIEVKVSESEGFAEFIPPIGWGAIAGKAVNFGEKLSTGKGWRAVADLLITGIAAKVHEGVGPLKDYELEVVTSKTKDAGTDADVYILIQGSAASRPDFQLDSEGNNFERGQIDRFKFRYPDFGNITKIELYQNNHGDYAGWKPESVIIKEVGSGKKWTIPCDWLADDEGGRRKSFQPK